MGPRRTGQTIGYRVRLFSCGWRGNEKGVQRRRARPAATGCPGSRWRHGPTRQEDDRPEYQIHAPNRLLNSLRKPDLCGRSWMAGLRPSAPVPCSAGGHVPHSRASRTIGDRSPIVIGHSSFRSQAPTGSCWTVDMTQPGPDPDNYPPIDPTEPVPDDPGPLSPDTPDTLPPAPVEPMPGPDDPHSVPAGQSP